MTIPYPKYLEGHPVGVDVSANGLAVIQPAVGLDFVGATLENLDNGVVRITFTGDVPSTIVKDEGTTIVTTSTINFVGAGVTVTDVGGVATVTIDGGGGGGGGTTNASDLTSGTLPDGRFPATLPAASGVNLTALNASNLGSGTVPDARFPATLPALSGANLTALNASNLASGTIPNARFPATLPAASGVNLTALNASNLGSGTVPTARLGSGTADSTTFLRGDQTYATPAGSNTTVHAFGSVSGAQTFNYASYQYATITLTGDVTLTVSNPLASGNQTTVTIIETGDGSHQITYAGLTVTFPQGAPPILASGAVRTVQLISTDGTTALGFYSSGPQSLNTQTADYTAVLTDAQKCIVMNKATAVDLTVPVNASVAYPIGTRIDVYNKGAGLVTIVADSGVTIRCTATSVLKAQYALASLLKIGTNEWVLTGDLA